MKNILLYANLAAWTTGMFLGCILNAEDLSKWQYYGEVEVQTQPWDTIQEAHADFSYLLSKVKANGIFDENSIRICPVDEGGRACVEPTPMNFVKDQEYEVKDSASGRVLWLVEGNLDNDKTMRKYRIYFDVQENGVKPPFEYRKTMTEANLVPYAGFEVKSIKDGISKETPYFVDNNLKSFVNMDAKILYKEKPTVRLTAREDQGCGCTITPYPTYNKAGKNYGLRITPRTSYLFGFWSKGEACAESKYKSRGKDIFLVSSVYWYNKKIEWTDKKNPYMDVCSISGSSSWDWYFGNSVLFAPADAYYGYFRMGIPVRQGTVWIADPVIRIVNPPEIAKCYENK